MGFGTISKPFASTSKGLGACSKAFRVICKGFEAVSEPFVLSPKGFGGSSKPFADAPKGFGASSKAFWVIREGFAVRGEGLGFAPKPMEIGKDNALNRRAIEWPGIARSKKSLLWFAGRPNITGTHSNSPRNSKGS
jgi:hypothetical protein